MILLFQNFLDPFYLISWIITYKIVTYPQLRSFKLSFSLDILVIT